LILLTFTGSLAISKKCARSQSFFLKKHTVSIFKVISTLKTETSYCFKTFLYTITYGVTLRGLVCRQCCVVGYRRCRVRKLAQFGVFVPYWIGHILRRNCLLQWVTEGKIQGGIEMTERQGRRRRKLLDDLKEREDTLI
jgi:hypothetical protein